MSKILVDKVVLEQALEALEADNSKLWPSDRRTAAYFNLRAALAEPVQAPHMYPLQSERMRIDPVTGDVSIGTPSAEPVQEPAGQLQEEAFGRGQVLWFKKPPDLSMLYTAPPQRKPLTDKQKLDLVTNWFSEDWAIKNALGLLDDYDIECARVIGE